jgi:hypothetical protein
MIFDTLVYDPTITLTLAFGDQTNAAPVAQTPDAAAVAQLNQAVNVGMVVGILVAIVAAVAIILVFLLVPSVRHAVQPYFGFKKMESAIDEGDATQPFARGRPSMTPTEASPAPSSAGSKKGWVTAKPPV